MYYQTKLTINRCDNDSKLATYGLFRQTFEINTITFEKAIEEVSRLTYRYRPCQVVSLYTAIRKEENDNV